MWKGLEHISIRVQDLEKARDFYQRMLGLTESDRQEIPAGGLTLLTMSGKGLKVELLYAPQQREAAGWDHAALEVEDIEGMVRELKAAGLAEEPEIRETLEGTRICFFQGPSGERWELIERRTQR